jgi:hypothetical protein
MGGAILGPHPDTPEKAPRIASSAIPTLKRGKGSQVASKSLLGALKRLLGDMGARGFLRLVQPSH